MRSLKFVLCSMLFAIVGFTSDVFAIAVEPTPPYTFDTAAGSSRMFVATTDAALTGWVDTNAGFQQFDITNVSPVVGAVIPIKVTGIPTDKERLQIFVGTTSNGNMIAPIYPNTTDPDTANLYPVAGSASDYYYSVKTNGNTDVWVYINLLAICTVGGGSIEGCNGTAVQTSSSGSWGFQFKAVPRDDTETLTAVPTTITGDVSFSIVPQSAQGTTTCIGAAPYFFPADGAISVDPGRFTHGTNSSSSVKNSLIVLANIGAVNFAATTWATSNTIVARGAPSGEQSYGGFTNFDPNNGSVQYQGAYVWRDSAGVITSTNCAEAVMVAGEIASFLKESNCFIAGASFRDENAKPVLLLRKFRDQILAKSMVGRKFIGFYYTRGPIAAQWLKEHPQFRSVALNLLIPVQVLAWVALHPQTLWIPFFALIVVYFVFLFSRRQGRAVISILAFAVLLTQNSTADETAKPASNSPYIDSLLSGMEEEEGPRFERTPENPDPYIQARKKRLQKKESSTGYAAELQKELDATEDPTGYTEEEKRRLGPSGPKSAIADFRSGKKLKERRGDTRAKGSFGFRLMTASNRVYNAGSAEEVAYNTAYGSKWTPDLLFTFERRPFKAWAANRLGVLGAFGFSWSQADAQFKYALPGGFSSTSHTKIKFITFPLLVGLTYKMNLFDFLYPYVGVGPGVFFFYESRSDGLGNSRGYSFGNWMIAGMNFGLDWLSKDSSWDRYASSGIKHSYFSVEYSRQNTFSGGLVDMTVDGVSIGFNFEI